jgi:hypothetical protein
MGDAIAQWTNRDGAEYGTSWPLRLFEGSAASADVLSTEAHAMRVKEWRAEREVPLREVFGPRVDEVVQLVDRLERVAWLQAGPSAEQRVAELVAQHYAALADYGPVRAVPPVRVVRTWHEARDAHDVLEPRPAAATAAIEAGCLVRGGTIEEIATQLVQHKVARVAYFGAWDAAWREAGRSMATGIHAVPILKEIGVGDDHSRMTSALQSVDGMVKALAGARDAAWRAGWDAAYELFIGTPGELPPRSVMFTAAAAAGLAAFWRAVPYRPIHSSRCATCARLPSNVNGLLTQFFTHTSWMVWAVGVHAAQATGWRAAYLINAGQRADPWKPLVDIWQLGGWPLGVTKGSFLVFLPEPRN